MNTTTSTHTRLFNLWKTPLIFLLLAGFFSSCNSSTPAEPKNFSRNGISFQCPEGWEINDEDSLDGKGYYLAVEKKGMEESALLTITWINGEIPLEYFLETMKEEFKNNAIYANSNLKISKNFEANFGNEKGIACTYTGSILGVDHEGTVYSFNGNGKVLSVLRQEAVEDKEKNAAGFALLEKSFTNK